MFKRKRKASAAPTSPDGRNDDFGLPTEDAEAAMFWEQEELATQNRWDQQEEIDYNQLARQNQKTRSSEMVNYNRLVTRTVKYLGVIKGLQDNRPSGDDRLDLIAVIDKSQRDGRLPWQTQDEDKRVLTLSKYGVKVMDENGEQVMVRHALHRIANLVFYEDRYGHSMLALKVGDRSSDKYDVYVYEPLSAQQAEDMCATLAQAFESVYTNWQRNDLSG